MAKPIAAVVKLQVPAGQATPAPPVGTALGPHGVNIMEFVKQFNAKTAHAQGMITPVEVTIFKDRTFTFVTKTPPAAVLLKKEAGIEKGSHVQPAEGGQGDARAGQEDRGAQDARSQRQRPRGGHEDGRGNGPLDGPRGDGLMPGHGKRYRAAVATLEPRTLYGPREAVEKVKATASAKFDESVDIAVRLGVDPKHADQVVRGTVSLPAGTGKKIRVLAIAQGEKAKEAEAAGAYFVGVEYIQKIKDGWLDTDVIVATPDLMGQLAPLGKILGPRGLMPNPKAGTVTMDVARAVKELKAGKIEFRVDKSGIVHAPTGKKSFAVEALEENLRAFMEAIVRARPAAAKGHYIRSITVSSTMGPGVPVDPAVFA